MKHHPHGRICAAGLLFGFLALSLACPARAPRAAADSSEGSDDASDDPIVEADPGSKPPIKRGPEPAEGFPTARAEVMPGWPIWIGEVNHQISGLAFRDGRLYAVSDQSGVETRALLELVIPADTGRKPGSPDGTAGSGAAGAAAAEVKVLCRWEGGPHPDAEGLALDPPSGAPERALIPLESKSDALIEIGFEDCALLGVHPGMTGVKDNTGIEGVAVSADRRLLYFVNESDATLLTMSRSESLPARLLAKINGASTLCDIAYDDRGTPSQADDRFLLLDRNRRQIFAASTQGKVLGRWRFEAGVAQKDPEGHRYGLVSFESLAIAGRETDGSVIVFAATDPPPPAYPYGRTDGKDPDARYARRVGMLYKLRLLPPR